MTTLEGLIAETKRHLQSFQREPMNRLASPLTTTSNSVAVEFDASHIQPGSHLQVGLELMYVWSVDNGTKTATVQRAQLGSVAAAHAAGAVVTVNPKHPDFAIAKAINDEMVDLSSPANGLFAVRSVDLVGTAASSDYDLAGASDLLEVIEVRRRFSGASREWTSITNYELTRQVSATDFPSGLSLMLSEGVSAGQPIRVLYKASFTPLVNLADDALAVGGMPVTMQDIPPMGAAIRMTAPREIKRNFTEAQGEPRRAQEVPPGAVQASMRGVAILRQGRIQAEAARLSQQFPDRGFVPQSNSAYGGWRQGYARGGRRWA